MGDDITTLRAVLAIEARPGPGISAVLERPSAEALGDAIAADLVRLLPGITDMGVAIVGALYDQTQILSPKYPVHSALELLYRESLRGPFEARRLSIGAAGGALPKTALKPSATTPPGPMYLVPIALLGRAAVAEALSAQLERTLVDAGQASAATALLLKDQFGVEPVHAQYLSIDDLAAMLCVQLESIGLPELWTLLEGALYAPAEACWVTPPRGGAFTLRDGCVDALFQTFDAWAGVGAGAALAAEDELVQGYGEYVRALRQVSATLAAHGLEVEIYPILAALPEGPAHWTRLKPEAAAESFAETAVEGPREGAVLITEHATGQLGTLAFTVEWRDPEGKLRRRENHYPVRADGVGDCLNRLQSLPGSERTFAYPGRIVCDPEARCLVSDPDALGSW